MPSRASRPRPGNSSRRSKPPVSWAATSATTTPTPERGAHAGHSTTTHKRVTMEAITFPNGPVTMAGHLYLPDGFDPQGSYAAIVTVHPAGGVKEQTAGLYARKLAEQGFVALAFDASYQGDSGGEPHHLEDPYARVEDIRAA